MLDLVAIHKVTLGGVRTQVRPFLILGQPDGCLGPTSPSWGQELENIALKKPECLGVRGGARQGYCILQLRIGSCSFWLWGAHKKGSFLDVSFLGGRNGTQGLVHAILY